jgi:hypothetical protein
MSEREYLGKLANEIEPEKLAELLKKGYSVSPRSGRIRERFRKKEKKKEKFNNKKLNKTVQKVGWVILLLLFLASILLIVPNIGNKYDSNAKKTNRRN